MAASAKIKGAKFRTHASTDVRLPGSRERMVGHNGELNAGSKMELAHRINELAKFVAEGNNVLTEEAATSLEDKAKMHREWLVAAYQDAGHLRELGETMADELYISSARDGFARRLLARNELNQGQLPRIRMVAKSTTAIVATSPSRTETQFVRDMWFNPREFYITARPYVEKRDMDSATTDLLDEKYNEALQAFMVQEDRVWKRLADRTVGMVNELTTITGTMTPLDLANMRNVVSRWNIPATTWLMANDLWGDVIGDSSFMQAIDPVSKFELLQTGYLGRILGMDVISDAFRMPQHKVLSRGEMYIVGAPVNHGAYTDRGGIDSLPLDGSQESVPGRGWFMSQSMSQAITNVRSVARGRRV